MANKTAFAINPPIPERNTDPYEVVVHGVVHKVKPVVHDVELISRIPIGCVPTNLPLPCPLYVRVGDRYVMFRHQKDQLTDKRVDAFLSKGIDAFYILKSFWKIFVEALETLELPDDAPVEEKIRHVRSLLMAYTGELDQKVDYPNKLTFNKLEALSGELAKAIQGDPMTGLKLIRRNSDPTIYFVNHAINSGIYAALIGRSLNYPFEDLKQLIYAGLVHDFGNVYLPKTILYKKGKLTPEEIEVMKTHTGKGAHLLKTMGADARVVAATYQHHERVDGHGYPEGISGKEIHPFAKIIAISDVYDAITCNRPHQKGLSSAEAMKRMRSEEGLFDLDFLSKISFAKGDEPVPESET